MKELSIEEKAKAYDEAIAKVKQIQNTPYTAHWDTMKEVVQHLFPNLKETEDEIIIDRIKKAVINYWSDEALDEILAWLEKQDEQNPWSEDDEAIYYGVIETEQYMLDVVNGIKKFDVGNASIKEDCTRELNWLRTLKDRVFPQPKQEWSEEDNNCICKIINWLDVCKAYNQDSKSIKEISEHIQWLKSLRPQSKWKPSEEQMDAISVAVRNMKDSACYDSELVSLYNDLKKLREE